MATIALAVPIAQATPLRPNRRDIAASQGDDVTLQFTIYDTDTATTPKDVTGGALRFRLNGVGACSSETEIAGSIIDAATGRMDVVLADTDLTDLSGEYGWQAQWALAGVYTTICAGAFLLRPEAPDA